MSQVATQSKNRPDTHRQTNSRPNEPMNPRTDLMEYAKSYAREKPEVVALWCLGVGFILGWKLKPW